MRGCCTASSFSISSPSPNHTCKISCALNPCFPSPNKHRKGFVEISTKPYFSMAERVGFEPTVHCCTLDFESSTFDHSDTSPQRYLASVSYLLLLVKGASHISWRSAHLETVRLAVAIKQAVRIPLIFERAVTNLSFCTIIEETVQGAVRFSAHSDCTNVQ